MAIGTIFGCQPSADALARRPHQPMRSTFELQARRYIRGTGRRSWSRVIAQNVSRSGCTPIGSKPKTRS